MKKLPLLLSVIALLILNVAYAPQSTNRNDYYNDSTYQVTDGLFGDGNGDVPLNGGTINNNDLLTLGGWTLELGIENYSNAQAYSGNLSIKLTGGGEDVIYNVTPNSSFTGIISWSAYCSGTNCALSVYNYHDGTGGKHGFDNGAGTLRAKNNSASSINCGATPLNTWFNISIQYNDSANIRWYFSNSTNSNILCATDSRGTEHQLGNISLGFGDAGIYYIDNFYVTNNGIPESPDTTSPGFSNFEFSPANASVYNRTTEYVFNATLSETGTTILNFNGTNYTSNSSVSNEFSFTLPSRPQVGNYTIFYYSNDSSGNRNTSQSFNYLVNTANSSLSLTFNLTSPLSFTQDFLATCNINTGEASINFTRNGTTITNNSVQSLAAGVYLFNCSTPLGTNFTATYNSSTISVSKRGTNVSLYLNYSRGNVNLNLSAAMQVNVTGVNLTSTMNASLYINGSLNYTNVTPFNFTLSLAAGFWVIHANFSGNENYSLSGEEWTANITDNNSVSATSSQGEEEESPPLGGGGASSSLTPIIEEIGVGNETQQNNAKEFLIGAFDNPKNIVKEWNETALEWRIFIAMSSIMVIVIISTLFIYGKRKPIRKTRKDIFD